MLREYAACLSVNLANLDRTAARRVRPAPGARRAAQGSTGASGAGGIHFEAMDGPLLALLRQQCPIAGLGSLGSESLGLESLGLEKHPPQAARRFTPRVLRAGSWPVNRKRPEERGRRTRRETLTREKVLHTAMALVDEEGLEGLSMRRLASALDVHAMSLYNHVSNKADLLDDLSRQEDFEQGLDILVRGLVAAADKLRL